MSMYREEVNKYKAKRIGQVDAKVSSVKNKQKKVVKPWAVYVQYNLPPFSAWKPRANKFAHEHDARKFLNKHSNSQWQTRWLEYNGEKVE